MSATAAAPTQKEVEAAHGLLRDTIRGHYYDLRNRDEIRRAEPFWALYVLLSPDAWYLMNDGRRLPAGWARDEVSAEFKAMALSVHAHPETPSKGVMLVKGKWVTLSWTKLIRRLARELPGAEVDEHIEAWQAFLATALDLGRFTFEEAFGGEVYDAYATGPDSCMAGFNSAVKLYAENPDKVSVLKIFDEEGEYVGRGLLWTLDDNRGRYLDRLYPSDGGAHLHAAARHARAMGWYMAIEHGVNGAKDVPASARVTLLDVDAYPYMDTFGVVATAPWESKSGEHMVLAPYGSGASTSCDHMSFTDNTCPWDDTDYVTTGDGDRIPRDDAFFDEESGEWWHIDVGVMPVNGDEFVHEDSSNIEPTVDGDFIHVGRYADTSGWLELTWGAEKGKWAEEGDVIVNDDTGDAFLSDELTAYCDENGFDQEHHERSGEFVKRGSVQDALFDARWTTATAPRALATPTQSDERSEARE